MAHDRFSGSAIRQWNFVYELEPKGGSELSTTKRQTWIINKNPALCNNNIEPLKFKVDF
jgi:hypothetical protein